MQAPAITQIVELAYQAEGVKGVGGSDWGGGLEGGLWEGQGAVAVAAKTEARRPEAVPRVGVGLAGVARAKAVATGHQEAGWAI